MTNRAANETIAALGAAAIVLSLATYSRQTPFPGAAALPPVLGTCAIIYAGMRAPTVVSRALSSTPVVFVGLISYSLYLWHWPIMTLAAYYAMRPLTLEEGMAAILVSIALATLTWRLVEVPFRRPHGVLPTRSLFRAAALSSLTLAVVAVSFHRTQGFPARFPPSVREIVTAREARVRDLKQCDGILPQEEKAPASCHLGVQEAGRPTFLVWGDSHGAMLLSTLGELAIEHRWNGSTAVQLSCPPVTNFVEPSRTSAKWRQKTEKCIAFNDQVLKTIADGKYDRVVLAARWIRYLAGGGQQPAPSVDEAASLPARLYATAKAISHQGIDVTIVGPVPEHGFDVPRAMVRTALWGAPLPQPLTRESFDTQQREVLSLLSRLESLPHVTVVYPGQAMCDLAGCRYARDGEPFYYDENHLTAAGAREVGRALEASIFVVPQTAPK
jgi:hypothetical protein